MNLYTSEVALCVRYLRTLAKVVTWERSIKVKLSNEFISICKVITVFNLHCFAKGLNPYGNK